LALGRRPADSQIDEDAPMPPGSIPNVDDGQPGSRGRGLLNKLFGAI